MNASALLWVTALLLSSLLQGGGISAAAGGSSPVLSKERVVFQLQQGDIEFAFYPEVAPITSAHIFTLVQLGLYNTNQFFRVDKGFVAQTSDVASGRLLPLNDQQKELAGKTVPLEVQEGVKHHEGRISMARGSDPHSGSNSFFVCYGPAPHLDMQYGIFGEVTRGMDVLHKLETLPTKREGIFVMPVERVTITSTYWYTLAVPQFHSLTAAGTKTLLQTVEAQAHQASRRLGHTSGTTTGTSGLEQQDADNACEQQLAELLTRFVSQAQEVEELRAKQLP